MLSLLRSLLGRKAAETAKPAATPTNTNQAPPLEVVVGDTSAFALGQHLLRHEGYPIPDWQAVQTWTTGFASPDLQGLAWTAIERAWLLHMRESLGLEFRVQESTTVLLLSSLETNVARTTIDYMERTLGRVIKLLDGIAEIPPLGKDILLVFNDDKSYYRYVSYYYPEGGEFAFSGGMHINAGCSHYVTVKNDLHAIEPVIAHEMTHGCLGHLPLPVWLNEGLAVNIEQRLTGVRPTHTPQQLRSKHLAFWGTEEIQQFWTGESFLRTDDGNLLSYDLARLMVEHMGKDWEVFKQFALSVSQVDAGASAARECLGVELGELVCVLLDQRPSAAWEPAE
jgi:hypothetical protein